MFRLEDLLGPVSRVKKKKNNNKRALLLPLAHRACPYFFFFFFTLVTSPRRSLSLNVGGARVYEPQMPARVSLPGGMDLSGRGTTRAEDAQGTPTQSRIPCLIVYEDKQSRRVGVLNHIRKVLSIPGGMASLWTRRHQKGASDVGRFVSSHVARLTLPSCHLQGPPRPSTPSVVTRPSCFFSFVFLLLFRLCGMGFLSNSRMEKEDGVFLVPTWTRRTFRVKGGSTSEAPCWRARRRTGAPARCL